jgi:hypothetical protein
MLGLSAKPYNVINGFSAFQLVPLHPGDEDFAHLQAKDVLYFAGIIDEVEPYKKPAVGRCRWIVSEPVL